MPAAHTFSPEHLSFIIREVMIAGHRPVAVTVYHLSLYSVYFNTWIFHISSPMKAYIPIARLKRWRPRAKTNAFGAFTVKSGLYIITVCVTQSCVFQIPLFPTLKKAPAEAELPRPPVDAACRYIKKARQWPYTWMPLGWRVLRR